MVDEVAICLPFSQWDRVNAIARLCEEEGKIVRVPVDMLDRAFARPQFEDLDGTPVYSLVSGPDRLVALAVKRAFDIVVSGGWPDLGSPILLAIALSIRLRDGAPVLFRQTRIGLHGRRFRDAEVPHDGRSTRSAGSRSSWPRTRSAGRPSR